MAKRVLIGLLSALLPGCMFGPNYERPKVDLPANWSIETAQPAETANLAWWEQFQDETLNGLIRAALEGNQDLKAAAARIDQFYARYGVTRSELFPQIYGEGAYQRSQSSNSLGMNPQGRIGPRNNYSININTAWELDLWGRVKRASEAAMAELLSQEAARRAIVLSLVSSVAKTYVQLRDLDERLRITNETLKTRKSSLELARTRFQNGLVSELDAIQAEAEYEATLAGIPRLEKLIAETEHALSFLLGKNPAPLRRGQAIQALSHAAVIPAGLPSDLLTQRPDIVQAEEELAAANALIGAAKADYFPRLTLTGLFGFQSVELKDFLDGPAKTWSFGPTFSIPAYTGGRLGSQVDLAEARKREALFNYQKAVLNALKETEDALTNFQKSGEELDARTRQTKVSRRYLDLATQRYTEGQTSYLEVLDAERALFASQLSLSEAQANRVLSLIALYAAMGGGWVLSAENYSPNVPQPASAQQF